MKEDLIERQVSYQDICKEFNIQPVTGKQKILQLERLSDICDIEKIPNSTKYIITRFYTNEERELIEYLKAPKQQLMFDAVLYKAFLNNGDKPLYLSNTQMLSIFGEVNSNFQYTFSRDIIEAINPDFLYMVDMTKEVYEILHQWTRRRIDNMASRFVIIKRRGFRLYYNNIGAVFSPPLDVPADSQLEKRCQKIMIRAIDAIFKNDKYIIRDSATNEVISFHWMPEGLWRKFENKINELTREEFKEEGFNRLNLVTILSPAPKEIIKEKLENIEKRMKELNNINENVQKKIINSKSKALLEFSDAQKKEYIEYNIKKNPPAYFKNKLEENDKNE